MPRINRHPSYVDCVAQALSSAINPLSMDELVEAVAAQRPLTKSARTAIYQAISKLHQAVPLGDSLYGWLDRLLLGNVFRHSLTKTELRRGVVYLDELLHSVFVPAFFQDSSTLTRSVTLDLLQGDEAMVAPIGVDRSTWALQIGPELGRWVDAVGGQPKDDLVIRVDDAVAGRYTLRLVPREMRDEELLSQRNLEVAQAAEALLIQDRKMRGIMPVWELVALLVGKGLFRLQDPPDELHYLLTRFSGLKYVEGQGYSIRSAERAYRKENVAGTPKSGAKSILFGSDIEELDAIIRGLGVEMNDLDSLWGDDPDDDGADDEGDFFGDDAGIGFGSGGAGALGLGFPDQEDEDDACLDYQLYLDAFEEVSSTGNTEETPLSHDNFHILEAELEFLISLRVEFGYLMADQQARVIQLGERLFLDPDTFLDDYLDDLDGGLDGGPDGTYGSGYDGPPFWDN